MCESDKIINDIYKGFEKYEGLKGLLENFETLNKDDFKMLYSLGVIFLGVDTFLQNEINNIIEYIRKKGFNIIKLLIRKRLTRSEIENLFLPNNGCLKCGAFRWWMIEDSINWGPMMAVIIHSSDATADEHCLLQLNTIKGYGDPFYGKPDTIRNDFPAINFSMNLIHIPDNYADFIKDISPFFSVSQITDILKQTESLSTHKEKGINNLSKIELFDIYINSNTGNFKYSFFRSLYLAKFELLKSIRIGVYVYGQSVFHR